MDTECKKEQYHSKRFQVIDDIFISSTYSVCMKRCVMWFFYILKEIRRKFMMAGQFMDTTLCLAEWWIAWMGWKVNGKLFVFQYILGDDLSCWHSGFERWDPRKISRTVNTNVPLLLCGWHDDTNQAASTVLLSVLIFYIARNVFR